MKKVLVLIVALLFALSVTAVFAADPVDKTKPAADTKADQMKATDTKADKTKAAADKKAAKKKAAADKKADDTK